MTIYLEKSIKTIRRFNEMARYIFFKIQRLVKDGRVEDVHSLPVVRALESQLTDEQALTGRHQNSPKEISHIQRQRRSCNEMVGGAQSQ